MKNKIGIITGGTSGIGQGIAKLLSEAGAKLILSGQDEKKGIAVSRRLDGENQFIPGDVKNPDLNQRLVEEAISRYGRLDYVVLSAGTLGIGKLHEMELDTWHDAITTNLNAVFYLLKHALPAMQAGEGGSVVVIGSVAAFHAFPNHPAYTASKGALIPLVKQLALDYGPQIRINIICPAQVKTPLLENSVSAFPNPESILDQTAQRLPMKRLGLPSDIAQATAFLLSEKASWITGSHFVVDGGFLAT